MDTVKQTPEEFTILDNAVRCLVEKRNTYCIGLSGGSDSVALAHILQRLRGEYGIQLAALHLNHTLRSRESERDAEFCAKIAKQWGMTYYAERVDAGAYAREHGLSIEDAARRCRYEWFSHMSERLGAAGIFLAHHADDQAETLLLRLIRGTGTRGLGGMKTITHMGNLTIIRPWLHIRRTAIEEYRHANSIPCCYDSSNSDTRFDRNWIRHEIVPVLETRFGKGVTDRLVHTAEISRAAQEQIHASAMKYISENKVETILGPVLSKQTFVLQSCAIQREVIIEMISEQATRDCMPGFEIIEGIREYISGSARHCPVELPGGAGISKAGDRIIFSSGPRGELKAMAIQPGEGYPVTPDIELRITRVEKRGAGNSDNGEGWQAVLGGEGIEMVQYGHIPEKGSVIVRSRRAGDRYTPVNGSRKKVKDILINAGIPGILKGMIPVIEHDGRLVWMAGWRIGEEYKVEGGKWAYRLSCRIQAGKKEDK